MRREEDSVGVIAADSATLTAQYDQVVVVEPAEIIEAEQPGLNRLYVVLTHAMLS